MTITGTNLTGAQRSSSGQQRPPPTGHMPDHDQGGHEAPRRRHVKSPSRRPGGPAKSAAFTFVTAPTITTFTPTSGSHARRDHSDDHRDQPDRNHLGQIRDNSSRQLLGHKPDHHKAVPSPTLPAQSRSPSRRPGGSGRPRLLHLRHSPDRHPSHPRAGSTLGGTPVTITGTNLTATTMVTFGDNSATTTRSQPDHARRSPSPTPPEQ